MSARCARSMTRCHRSCSHRSFVTSHPNWLWLNRLQCLAVGRVTMADLLVRFDLYAIRVGQPLLSSGLPRVDDAALIGDVH